MNRYYRVEDWLSVVPHWHEVAEIRAGAVSLCTPHFAVLLFCQEI